MHLTNLIITWTFFNIASYQLLKNDMILINQESFFQEKGSSQLYYSQFVKIISLIDETIENQFSKTIFLLKKLLKLVIVYSF